MSTSLFAIGIGGHQNLGGKETCHFVEQQFRSLLTTYQQGERHLVVYSALARGTDQLFVRIALDVGVRVEIVIPCAEYDQIFSSEAEKEDYRQLLHMVHASHQLPLQTCSNEAYLAAEQWIIDRSDLVILAWNGLPPQGRSGTGDMASYARFVGCPFIHIDTRLHTVKTYSEMSSRKRISRAMSPKHEFIISQQPVYKGTTLAVNQYHIRMPNGEEITRDVMQRPESVFILPVGYNDIVLLVEEYNFGAGLWQLTLPGGKVEGSDRETLHTQAQRELRQEIGYRAGRLEKLIDLYSHPGYVSHHVHIFVAYDLEWDPLDLDPHEEIKVQTYTIDEALSATSIDYRCDPEAALALWLYAQQRNTRK